MGDGLDIVIIEGFKRSDAPKIEVHRAALGKDLACAARDLIAITTDEKLDVPVEQYDLNDISAIADFIEARFLKKP